MGKSKKAFVFIIVVIFSFLFAGQLAAVEKISPREKEIEKLRQEIDALKSKVDELDAEEAKKESVTPESVPEKDRSEIEYRDFFTDQQEAAPRPEDLTILPDYRGFIAIPHTPAMIRFNAKPRLAIMNDSAYAGNDNLFVPSQIPVSGQTIKDAGYHFAMSAQGSQLSMDIRAPNTTADPRFYYENDFCGTGNQYLNFRVRHLYGEFFSIVIGQTYTVFEDADAWPNTVDYEGPNAAISARRPLVRYLYTPADHWIINVSLEKPNVQVDTSNDPTSSSENRAPEGGFSVKWADRKIGHVQLGTIFRDISVHGGTVGEQSTFGWGVNLSASLNFYKKDSFQTQLTYGRGIFYFMNDATENNDAAFNAAGRLRPLPVVGLMGGLTHYWIDRLSSTASFGFVNVENQASQQWSAYHRTYYSSLNFVWRIYKRLFLGAEGLYGYKQVKSGASGQVFRGQIGIVYSIF